ncbi:hypothetical protein Tco_0989498 [Tanacetum coccineum]|uniref:Uncharacterized protein n=1 Tax=Tanacetum coccineum TaxID=301880 RepID=A0ABQ5EUH4_9ASTR
MTTLEFCNKHNMVAYLEKIEGSTEFHQIIDFLTASHTHYALTENPTIYASFIKQFWITATASTNVYREVKLNPSIDRQAKTITEASLRRHLKLEDDGGITSLPNTEIFEQLALIGYATDSNNLTFQKVFSNMKRVTRGYSGDDIPLFPSMITAPETSPSRITSLPSLSTQHTPISAPSTSPPPIPKTTPTVEVPAPMPHESPLQSVHSLGYDEGSVSLRELMALVTQLTNKVGSLKNELMNTKKVYGSAITKLVNRVKKLEKQVKTGTTRRGTKIVLSEDEAVRDSFQTGRKLIELVEDQGVVKKGNLRFLLLNPVTKYWLSVPFSTARATPEVSTAAKSLVYIRRSAKKNKDKGKAIVIEDESVQKKSKKQVQEERLGYEEAIRLQEQIDKEERKRIARDVEIAKQLYHALQNRLRSVAEVRKNMMVYLKNQGGYKMKDYKGMRYDDIRPIFEKLWDQIHSFVPMDSEEEVQRLKRAGQDVEAKPAKRQRTEEV